MNLEEQIRYYRKQTGLSQEKMAEKIGVSRQAVTKWENGTGIPDVANLVAIADLFRISVDELLSNGETEKKTASFLYESYTEYDIDGRKNIDMDFGGAHTVELKACEGEKIRFSLLSNVIKSISTDYKIKIDDNKNIIDVDLRRFNDATEAAAKEGLVIRVCLPAVYIGKIELTVNAKTVNICDIENENIEVGGKISKVSLQGNKSNIVLDCNLDMQIDLLSHTGVLEINQVCATSRLTVPADYSFRCAKKGISTGIYFEKQGKIANDFSNSESDNYIELNGMRCELVIAKREH